MNIKRWQRLIFTVGLDITATRWGCGGGFGRGGAEQGGGAELGGGVWTAVITSVITTVISTVTSTVISAAIIAGTSAVITTVAIVNTALVPAFWLNSMPKVLLLDGPLKG